MNDSPEITVIGSELTGYDITVDGEVLPRVDKFMQVPTAIGSYLVSKEAAAQQEKGERPFVLPEFAIFSRGFKVEASDAWEAQEARTEEGQSFGKWSYVKPFSLFSGGLIAEELTPELEDAIKIGRVHHNGREWREVY